MEIKFIKDEKIIEYLKNSIKEYNNEKSYYHKISRADDYVKHIIITEKQNDALIGGIAARHYWNMIYLDEFFVEREYRGKGFGKAMIKKLINTAREREVNFISLQTFSFQAREFYEKFGFFVIGEIEDYPPGMSMYTMRLNIKIREK